MSRSLLFIPGHRENMLSKAGKSQTDTVIFDLEDSVPMAEKNNGRATLVKFLREFDAVDKEVIIRVNEDKTIMSSDIEATLATRNVDGFMIPKATVESVRWVDSMLECMDAEDIFLVPMVESPLGLINTYKIASCSKRVKGMLFGAEDYTAEMGIKRTKSSEEIRVARNLFAIACRAADVEAYDTPYVDTKDGVGLIADSEYGKSIGLTGRTAIHPKQIDAINSVYMPSDEEVLWAERVVQSNEEAKAKGLGAFSLDGQMIDLPVVIRAKKTLDQINRSK